VREPIPSLFTNLDLRRVVDAVVQLIRGRTNAVGSFSLADSTTTTTVPNVLISEDSRIFLMPRTADAAAEEMYVSDVSEGEFTVTHSSDTSTRTFDYMIATRDE
jgi:hypothetical protein